MLDTWLWESWQDPLDRPVPVPINTTNKIGSIDQQEKERKKNKQKKHIYIFLITQLLGL